jgi:hypothetical protein
MPGLRFSIHRHEPVGELVRQTSRPDMPIDANSVEYSPFLQYVSDTESFDDNLKSYISTTYNQRQSV